MIEINWQAVLIPVDYVIFIAYIDGIVSGVASDTAKIGVELSHARDLELPVAGVWESTKHRRGDVASHIFSQERTRGFPRVHFSAYID
jgi:hypothetical protein